MAQMEAHDIIRRPIITEKSMDQMADSKYTFEVDLQATKPMIRKAVEEIFDVKVAKVNTMRVRGKIRRMGASAGRRPDWKKAIVTLKEGEIDFFEGIG